MLITSSLAFGQGTIQFGQPVTYPVGTNPTTLSAVDLDQNGVLDLVVSNGGLGEGGSLSVLLGRGDGTFQQQTDYRAENGAEGQAVGDLTGDGRPDILVANALANSVSLFRSNPIGRLCGRMDFMAGQEPTHAGIVDFDGDGLPDYAVTNFASNTVSISIARGHGRFEHAADYQTPSGPYALAVVDLNLDGAPDLVVGNLYIDQRFHTSPISIFLGRGDGTFGARTDFAADRYAGVILTGDFNTDFKPDLAVVNAESRSVTVLLGDGLGGVSSRRDYTTGDLPLGGAVGDVNRDGNLDLVVTNHQENTVSVFPGNGDGTFAERIDFPAGGQFFINPVGVVVADLNADAWPDLALTNAVSNTVAVLLNHGGQQANGGASGRDALGPQGESRPWLAVRGNPMNLHGPVEILYRVPVAGSRIDISVFSVDGREVARLVSGPSSPGTRVIRWDGIDGRGHGVGSGIYFVRASIGGVMLRSRVLIAK